ncbi:BTAD domain-containing putative transcriptional regulator [Amycolatopsis sp. A133]|uniref:BTAD domain-containing putative transcriptional regulator n=1 Tax=Amycolatopsis sp. A133 TaxID=3064472 RepID=UPI0027F3309B|nr:BTAD domain-containing putative transcriptional regulator [Amycolatopsis sp. A133]MDQ7810906.1 BTAD domain-containing putative transcriptional regulator [Amycolatopsis sp. A133]
MRLQLDLFGPVRAWRGGREMALGSAQRRALLAVLALKANQVVTRADLIDAIWGEKAPASANGSVYTYVSSLRAALDPDRPAGGSAVLTSGSSGYCLRVDAESIDVVRFENLRERARLCQRANDFPGARAALDSALALAREEPLAGLPGPYAATQRERLRELRLELVERRARIVLDEGGHQQVLADLRPFTAQHPLREGLQSLHLLALYRCGHRDEALRLFERLRAGTVDELGIEPGSELTTRYEQILADDPALWRQLANAPRTPAPAPAPRPAGRSGIFVGREDELALLRSVTDGLAGGRGASLWLEGEPGIGKSALVAAGLEAASGCTVALAGADELSRHTPLQVLLDCFDVTPASADPRRASAAHALRRLSLDDDHDLAAAVDVVTGLVTALCRERPLVLVLDDLQWADPATLEVWGRLARGCARLPLALVGVCRRVAGHSRLDELRGALAAHGTRVHTLGPLPEAEVHDLVTALTGAAPGPELRELARTAAGNPLFLRAVVEGLAGAEAPEPAVSEARPAVPPAALDAISRRLGFLSAAASEVLRWAALLDRSFTRADLAAALGRPAGEFDDVLSEVAALGLVVRTRGKLAFRHPVVREALYARTPAAFRLALHRQLAEALADAGAPVERVAFQLLAAPLPVDKWQCEWLTREVYRLAARSPLSAMRLLQRVTAANSVPAAARDALAIATARITLWLERDPVTGASAPAARTKDPAVVAELRWLLAYARLVCGNTGQAVAGVEEALRDPHTPAEWRSVATALRSRARVGWWPACTTAAERTAVVPAQRAPSDDGPAAAFWLGHWDAALAELTRLLRGGPVFARHTLGRPGALRQLSGVAAVIAAHRGRPDDARAHLMSVWTLAPAGEPGADGTDFTLAANALLAELAGRPEQAFALLAGLLEAEDGVACPWMPDLVRLAAGLGEHDRAKAATLLCERTPGRQLAALRCRALLDEDPLAALAAAGRSRRAGDRFGTAQAMEDAAALLAAHDEPVKAAAALHTALNAYEELGAVLDAERAGRRVRHTRSRVRR